VKIVKFGVPVVLGVLLAAPLKAQTTDETPTAPDLGRFLPKDGSSEVDGRRTLSAFPKNLGRSFIGVFSKDNLAPLLVGGSIAASSTVFDQSATAFAMRQGDGLGKIGATAGGMTVMAPLALGVFTAGRFAGPGTFRAASYDMTQAIIVSTVYTSLLKTAFPRERPDGSDNKSFPSGHASAAFAWATVANYHWGPKVGIPSFVAAAAIGLSRVQHDKHNLSDVLAGATLGYIVGRTVVRENGAPLKHRVQWSIAPATDAQGGGAGAGVSVTW
jgi:membrane-associated phospholipid phosphatase